MNIKNAIRIIKEIREALKIISLKVLCLKVCKEEELNPSQTNLLMAVIAAESGWNTKAICKNRDGSIDYGICQYNSEWYIKKMKLITKWEALNDQRKCFEVMAKRYKKGRLVDWVAYRNGSYKRFL